MIQRIQSLYLLLVSIFAVLVAALPLGRFLGGDEEFILSAFGIRQAHAGGDYIAGTIYLGILAAVSALLPFVTIFLFKNRMLQVRLCFMEIVLLLGVQIFIVYYLYHATSSFNSLEVHSSVYSVVGIFPLAEIILTWLAIKAVARDEKLVRSLDRIR